MFTSYFFFTQNDLRNHLLNLRYKITGYSAWDIVTGNTDMKRTEFDIYCEISNINLKTYRKQITYQINTKLHKTKIRSTYPQICDLPHTQLMKSEESLSWKG